VTFATGIVDINSATLADLDALPGVGPSTAQAIIDYRIANGPYVSVDDLLNVRGIGPSKLAAMRARVRV
jgi:competence protein ComEA